MMKVIFLDIDGVLNNAQTEDRFMGFVGLDKTLIENFNHITDVVDDVKIVISSTWRRVFEYRFPGSGLVNLVSLLRERGLRGEIVGATPILSRSRGQEIRAWLSQHPEVEDYVILDDIDEGFDEDQISRHVKTDFVAGLTVDAAEEAVELLS